MTTGSIIGDTLVVTVGPTARSEIAPKWPVSDVGARADWSHVLVLASALDDVSPSRLGVTVDNVRAAGRTTVVGYGGLSELFGSERVRAELERALAREVDCSVMLPGPETSLADLAEVFADLHSMDGPIGFDPVGLPFRRNGNGGAPLVDVVRAEVGRIPPLPTGVFEASILVRLHQSRQMTDYTPLWETYERGLEARLPFSLAMRPTDEGEGTKLLLFRR